MPLTFIEIEKQKTWRIGILFLLLLVMYFSVVISLFLGILFFFPFYFMKTGSLVFWNDPLYIILITGFSLLLAGIHFWFSASGAVQSVMKSLGAIPPDPEDGIHRRLKNIIDEIHVVTGQTRKIGCFVIPSLSMNAIAVADLKGNAAIAITEGLLSRLTRSQTEAVLAHEAYHILSRDCMEATIATSLFGMYAAMLEKLRNLREEERSGLHPAFFLFWVLLKLSQMLSMLISREREYRADAASVRMTRNPVAMAEALHLISRNWRGSGMIGSGLEMLCIINPQENELDESEGFWSTLMSTHPPIRKRIDILLKMVRVSIAELDRKLNSGTQTVNVPSGAAEPLYHVFDPKHKWQGPYALAELAALPWLLPLTWIRSGNDKSVERASENPLINAIFTNRLNTAGKEVSEFRCPSCKQSLSEIPYEKTKVYQCGFCRGVLVDNTKIPRIIARREKECTERIKSLAKAVTTDNQRKLAIKKLKKTEAQLKTLTSCPKCHNPMLRTFYSLAYLIEIDRCGFCNITWFDADELEMLQCIIENRMTATLDLS